MWMCFAINIAEQRSRLHAHGAQLRVDGNPVHRREVDDNAIIAQGPPRNIVTAAFDRDEKIVGARKLHGANDIGRVRTANDQAWMLVNGRIPNTSSRIVAGIAGQQRLPTESTSERLDGHLAHGGSSAAFEHRRFHVSSSFSKWSDTAGRTWVCEATPRSSATRSVD
jgi:hypothetical protein